MKVLMHSNQLGLRGTEVGLYNYARYNEEILGNESLVLTRRGNKETDFEILAKFQSRFPVLFYNSPEDLDRIVEKNAIDVFYSIKSGQRDGMETKLARTCVHAVFPTTEFHGDVYAYVSEWLARETTGGKKEFVPRIIHPPVHHCDLRDFLRIPKDAIVFGRHGGNDTFDIPFVHKAVLRAAERRKDVYFLFMGTNPIGRSVLRQSPESVIYLSSSPDPGVKSAFINTCDAMLHARCRGETFGQAIGEFSAHNKPVITYKSSPERAHIEILGEKALYYTSFEEVMDILMDFKPIPNRNWDCYTTPFSPENVMKKFERVFLNGA